MKLKTNHPGISFFLLGFLLFTSCFTKKADVPILVLADDSNFGTYTAELLKTEGFNEFLSDSLSSQRITYSYLKLFDILILAECKIEPGKLEIIEKYVKSGGNLIAFRPDLNLSELFGVVPEGDTISEAYLKINSNNSEGKGLSARIMQFHGTADLYSLNTGTVLAHIFTDQTHQSVYPAVVRNRYGNGHAVAFVYNLPKSIVYTRQGNPLFAGLEKDGIPGLRGMDLFTDGWVDTFANTMNQADQQMALLSNCIQEFNKVINPLPRLWYFPDTLQCLAVLDNDGEDNDEFDFEPQLRDIDSMGAKMTIYIKDVDKVSKEWSEKWTEKGFEISGHPDDTHEAGNPSWNGMNDAIRKKKDEIENKFNLSMQTNVNHWFVWCGKNEKGDQDFGAQARLEELHGIEMDANYAHYDIHSSQGKNYLGTPGYNQGNYTGSGLLMKYADHNGKTINVYQRFNSVYDQQYNEGSTAEDFFNCFKGLVDRSLHNDIFSIVSIKAHNNEYYFSKEPLMNMLAYAKDNNVPVWTALELLGFLKMKDEATFSNIRWKNNVLGFSVKSSLHHRKGLPCLVPFGFSDKKVKRVQVDGEEIEYRVNRIRELEYVFFTVEGGSTHEVSIIYK